MRNTYNITMEDWGSLNDTLEEQLRRQIIALKKENKALTSENAVLKTNVNQLQKLYYETLKEKK